MDKLLIILHLLKSAMNRILIVDDNKDILTVTQLVLELRDYKVKGIFRGEETMDAIKEFVPDVILLDIFLGTTSGIKICEEVKRLYPKLCVIMFSAHAKEKDVLQLCPADGFIPKPFDIQELLSTVEVEMGKCA